MIDVDVERTGECQETELLMEEKYFPQQQVHIISTTGPYDFFLRSGLGVSNTVFYIKPEFTKRTIS